MQTPASYNSNIPFPEPIKWSDPNFAGIAQLVYKKTGLVFPENRRMVAESGIKRAMKSLGVKNSEAYMQMIDTDMTLMDDLFAELTVGETYFFRDPDQLKAVREHVFPALQNDRTKPVRVWSAGCSTGEEPYTLAMMLTEAGLEKDALVLGTDISRARLRVAQRARYRKWSMRGVSQETIDRYFSTAGDNYDLISSIKRMADFKYLNLGSNNYPAPDIGIWGMDLIFCRNVVIYFDNETIRQVIARLFASLSDRGWLFMGASDPMISDMVDCDVITTKAGLAYRKKDPNKPIEIPQLDQTPVIVQTKSVPARPSRKPTSKPSVRKDGASGVSRSRNEGLPTDVGSRAKSQKPRLPEPTDQHLIDQIQDLANKGKLEESERICMKALEKYPTSSELWHLQSVLLTEVGKPEEAVQAAKRSIYLDRNFADAHLALGTALRKLGDDQGAQLAFNNARKIAEGWSWKR